MLKASIGTAPDKDGSKNFKTEFTTQKVKNERLNFFFNQTKQDDVHIFEEIPHRPPNEKEEK